MVKNFDDMSNRLNSIPACDGRKDRQTDRRTDRHLATAYSPRYAYASRGKNRRSTLPTELLTRRAVDVLMGMLACLANPTRQRNALRFLSPDHVLSTRGSREHWPLNIRHRKPDSAVLS